MAAITWWTRVIDEDPIVYEMTEQGWTAWRQTLSGRVVIARAVTLREVYQAPGGPGESARRPYRS